MRATVLRDELADSLALLERIAARNKDVPVLSGVLVQVSDALRLRATDLETMAVAAVDLKDGEAGAAVVDARLLHGLVRRMTSEDVTIATAEDGVVVHGGGARFSLRTMPADDFPELMAVEDAQALTVPARDLGRALSRVAVAAAGADQRPILSGVLVERAGGHLELVATDASRLACEKLDLESLHDDGDPVRAILPHRATEEIARICERASASETAMLEMGARLAAVEVHGFRLVTRLIEGSFPPYQSLILQEPKVRVTFQREALVQAIERLAVLSRKAPAVVRFEPGGSGLGLSVRLRNIEVDVGEGEEIVTLEDGEWPDSLQVAYQARYLLDALRPMEVATVTYEVGDPQRASQWRAGSALHLIMPVRLA